MSKFWYHTEKSKHCRKSSNESIYKVSSMLPSTLSKFEDMQELHFNGTLHCNLRRGACHTVRYFSKPPCLENVETFLQRTNGRQYYVQMKPYSQFSDYKRPSETKPDRTPTLPERCLHRVSNPVQYSFKDSHKATYTWKTSAVSTVLPFCWCVFEYSTVTKMLPIRM
jgi:hypothetical protein